MLMIRERGLKTLIDCTLFHLGVTRSLPGTVAQSPLIHGAK
jgi:hypothetical protein